MDGGEGKGIKAQRDKGSFFRKPFKAFLPFKPFYHTELISLFYGNISLLASHEIFCI